MNIRDKTYIKQCLLSNNDSYDIDELQKIIEGEFFDDSVTMDTELIDLAVKRIAYLRGVSAEIQMQLTANSALNKWIQDTKRNC